MSAFVFHAYRPIALNARGAAVGRSWATVSTSFGLMAASAWSWVILSRHLPVSPACNPLVPFGWPRLSTIRSKIIDGSIDAYSASESDVPVFSLGCIDSSCWEIAVHSPEISQQFGQAGFARRAR